MRPEPGGDRGRPGPRPAAPPLAELSGTGEVGQATAGGALAARPAAGPAGAAGPGAAGRGPWLGGLGRTLLLLFPPPAEPRQRSPLDKARIALATFAIILVAAGVQLLRQNGSPPWISLYAEDGSIFLPRGVQGPGAAIFREYAGYLQLLPQLIADLVARFPLIDAPAIFAIAGSLVSAGIAVFAYHASSGHIASPWLRVLLGCSVILLAPSLIEIANNGVNTPWYLMFGLFWALLWRPRSPAGKALAAVIAFAAMASNFVTLLYLPLVVARVVALPRVREQAVTFGWLAGIAFQVPGLLESSEPRTLAPVTAGVHFYGQHVMVPIVFGWTLAKAVQDSIGIPATIAIATLIVAAAVAWVMWRGDSRVRAFAVMAVIMSLILSIIPALIRNWVATGVSNGVFVPGSRYTACGILLIEGIAIVGVAAFLRGRAAHPDTATHAVVAVLLVGLLLGWTTSYRYDNVRSGNTWTATDVKIWTCVYLGKDIWQQPSVPATWSKTRKVCVPDHAH